MIKTQTIHLEHYKQFRAIHMIWTKRIHREDVKTAFDTLNDMLDTEDEAICVIVDVRDNGFMPLTDTFKGALFGPHRHPKLAMWLVIGDNVFARTVADMLNRLGGSQKIQWFDNEAELDAFLEINCPYA